MHKVFYAFGALMVLTICMPASAWSIFDNSAADPSELCTKPEVLTALKSAYGADYYASLPEATLSAARKMGATVMIDTLQVVGGTATYVPNIYRCTAQYAKGGIVHFQLEMMSNGHFVATRED
jgi:hypothetical protein